MPALQKHRQSNQATGTARDDGFKITVLPAAREATMPPQGMAMGKFQGDITTPAPLPRVLRWEKREKALTEFG